MKNYMLLLLIGITFLSCSNDDDSTNSFSLIGTWDWVESSGGIGGWTETPASTGNTIKLEIYSNSIKRYLNGNLESESNYSIEFEEYNGAQREVIIYENGWEQTIDLNEDSLTFYDRCDDCFQHTYIKE